MAKAYVSLALNGEYYGYDIFDGVFSSVKETIKQQMQRWFKNENAAKEMGVSYVTYEKTEDDFAKEFGTRHTYVCFWRKNNEDATLTRDEFKDAVDECDELNIDWVRDDICVLRLIMITEVEI